MVAKRASGKVARAARWAIEHLEQRVLLAVNVSGIPTWVDQGPAHVAGGLVEGIPADSITGAANAVATPVTTPGGPQVPGGNANLIYVASVNGGIWKTTNAMWSADGINNDGDALLDAADPDEMPHWIPVTDSLKSQSYTSIVFDPNDATFNTLYAGIGRNSSGAEDGGRLIGLIKTTNGGTTWTRVDPSTLSGKDVTAVQVALAPSGGDPVILVGTRDGLYISDDGGDDFDFESGFLGDLPKGYVTDIVPDPANAARFYVAIAKKGIFRTTNRGEDWTKITDNLGTRMPGVPQATRDTITRDYNRSRRIELAVHNSAGNNVLYAAVVANAFDLHPDVTPGVQREPRLVHLFRSTDQGNTWKELSIAQTIEPNGDLSHDGIDQGGPAGDDAAERGNRPFGIHPGGQGNIHLAIVAHPTNPNVVIVAGDRQPDGSGELVGPNADGTDNFSARILRGVVAADGATTAWNAIVGTSTAGTSPHPDARALTFDQNGNLLNPNDGGVYRLRDLDNVDEDPDDADEATPNATQLDSDTDGVLDLPGTPVDEDPNDPDEQSPAVQIDDDGDGVFDVQRRWESINGDINSIEFYSVAYDAHANSIIGGAQDNGVLEQTQGPPNTQWRHVRQGDGAIVAVDNLSSPGQSIHYVTTQNFGFSRIVYNDGAYGTAASTKTVSKRVVLPPVPPGILTSTRTLKSYEDLSDGALDGRGVTIRFIQPFVLNRNDPTRMLVGTNFLYESAPEAADPAGTTTGDRLRTVGGSRSFASDDIDQDNDGVDNADGAGTVDFDEFGPNPAASFGPVTAMAYGGMNGAARADDVAYVGVATFGADGRINGGTLYFRQNRTLDANGDPNFGDFVRLGNWPGQIPRDVVMDPTNFRVVYVTDGAKVFRSDDAGQNWTDITRNLPDIGKDLRTIEIVKNGATSALIVGGGRGIFRLIDPASGGAQKWSRFGRGLPALVVSDVHYFNDGTDDILFIGTKARGAWAITGQGAILDDEAHVLFTGTGGHDTMILRRSAADSSVFEFVLNGTVESANLDVETVQSITVQGLDGNDTLTIDEDNGEIKTPIDFQGGPGTNNQQRVNGPGLVTRFFRGVGNFFSTIGGWIADLFTDDVNTENLGLGIDSLGSSFSPSVAPPASIPLPTGEDDARAERKLAKLLTATVDTGVLPSTFKDVFDLQVVEQIRAYLAADATPTVPEFIKTLGGLSGELGGIHFEVDPTSVSGAATSGQIEFEMVLRVAAEKEGLPIDLGADAESIGLEIDAAATVDLAASLTFGFAFGIDLTEGLTDADAFYFRPAALGIEADVHSADLNFAAAMGFVEAQVVGGSVDLHAAVSATFNTADGKITDAEVAGDSPDSDVTFAAAGTLHAALPLQASIGSFSTPTDPALRPTVRIDTDDLFHVTPVFSTENFGELFNFDNIGPQDILNLLTQLGTFLGQFRDASVFQTEIPFTDGTTLGDAIDLGNAFTQKVNNFIKNSDGTPGYASATELAQKLADALGLPLGTIDLDYRPSSDELTFHVEFDQVFNILDDAPLDVGVDLSPLAGLQTSSTFDLSANLHVGLTFGIDLSPPAAGVTLAQRFFLEDAVASGQITLAAGNVAATANFAFIEVGTSGGTGTVNGTVALALKDPDSTSTHVTLADLVANVFSHPLDLLVGGGPTITGSASLALNNITVSGIPGVSAAPGANVSVTIADLKNPGAALVNVSGLGDLANLKNLSLADVIAALRGAVDFLRNLGDGTAFGSFLSTELPVLNTSVSDLLDYADNFAAKVQAFENDPVGSLQGIEQAIEGAFDLDPADFSIALANKDLLFNLHFDFDYGSGPVPFGLDLESLADGVSDPTVKAALQAASSLVQVSGSGTVGVTAHADLNLVLGIDFTDPLAPKPFLGDATGLNLTARAFAGGVNFDVNIGPLGAFVRNGTATVDASTTPGNDAPMSFTVDVVGKRYLSDLMSLDSGKVAVAFVGAAEINLPLFFPDATTPLGFPDSDGDDDADGVPDDEDGNGVLDHTFNLKITDLNSPGTTFSVATPDFASAFGSFDFLNNLGAVIDGIDFLLQKLQQALNSRVLGAKLPLLGDKLKDAAQFIDDFRDDVVSELQSELAGGGTVAAIQRALFGSIGPGGLNFLTLDADLHDDEPGPDSAPTANDVPVAVTGTERVEFDLHLAKSLASLSIPIDFDLGIPGLGLVVNPPSAVAVKLGFDFDMGFGISRNEGFYLKTGASDELNIDLDVSIPGFHATGDLAFLQVDVKDQPADPTHFTAGFAVDLKDPIGTGNHLTFADLSAANLGDLLAAKFNADVEVNLLIEATFGGSAVFPSLLTDFALNWDFLDADTTAGASFGGVPDVAFNNVRINLGSFFSRVVGPVLAKIQELTRPMQPVVDILTARLPVLSDISAARDFLDDNGDGDVTLLELAENPALATAVPQLRFINAIVRIVDIVNSIPSGAGSIEIGLGSFNLAGLDLRGGGIPSGFDPLANRTQTAGSIASQLTAIGNSVADEAKEFFSDMADVPSDGAGQGLRFPIIQNPASAFNLLLGKPADLFIYDMPPLEVGVAMDLFFPLLGPLGVQLSGSLSARADFAFGFDSTGIQQAFSSGDPLQVFNGFFVSDRVNANGTGADVPEVVLTGRIEAFGALNVVIASAGVGGGLEANVELNLNDPNDDGKVRADEIIANLPLCIFDVHGQLKAGLSAFVKIGFGWFSRTKRFNIAEVVLLDFNYDCQGPIPTPVLAQFTSSGVLRLNIGAHAAARLHGDTTDGDEVFVVNHLGGSAGNEKVSVTAFGFTQEFDGVSRVEADAGEGNDSITFIGVLAASDMQGGDGDDVLAVGDGAAILRGGEGNDQLSSGAAGDQLFGDGGDDTVGGNGGDDLLEGGEGHDVLDAAGGDDTARGGGGDDSIDTGDGNDLIEGGDGNDDVDAGAGADTARGGAGNDTLVGGDDADRLEGGADDDALVGEGGNDTLLGEGGNDRADGADGADTADGGDGNDTVEGGTADDTLTGGPGDDLMHGGEGDDSVSGNAGDDDLFGEAGADTLFGNDGNDLLDGGADDDQVGGGAGNDTIHGVDGTDYLLGDAGDDRMFGDAGNDTALGGEGNDSIEGGAGSDSLLGGAGNDTVRGQQDADRIFGDAGDDLLFGDSGADVISGGDDNDEAHGGSENDTIDGNAGNDNLFGDAGEDLLHGNAGGDTVRGNADNDVIFGDEDGDLLFGDAGDDDMVGGSASAGAPDGDDTMDGGSGNDVLAGDNALIVRRTDVFSRLVRTLAGPGMYNPYNASDALVDGAAAVTGDPRANPRGVAGRDVTLFDHSGDAAATAGKFGNDVIAGGAGDDLIFGQLGNDTLQGDASTAEPVSATDPSVDATTDGHDYVEGNGGNDLIFGNGGQDDLVGGSSDQFSLGTAAQRPDGADTIFGGSGVRAVLNDAGDATDTGHAADADVIVGDNGNIYRLVDLNSAGGATAFLQFAYDTYGPAKIIPRAVDLLDYTPDGVAANDVGGADLIHGEAGDDSIHGGSADDRLYGDGQDDDLFGESGNDWISGGAGDDGVLGDDGKLFTSRNGTAEPLYGIPATTQQFFSTNGGLYQAVIDPTGRLKKTADLEPFTVGGNDTIYGGLGNDSLHAGAGTDAVSGAEALPAFFNDPASTPVLTFNDATGRFDLMNINAPMVKVNGHLLNFLALDANNVFIDDGQDVLFGDDGNDWLVGGTNSDHLYGGRGNDVLNADDNLDTNGGANNVPDPAPFAGADIAYGGGGRDVLIGNSPSDRLSDWVGEFNSYNVPFKEFGNSAVARQILPGLVAFLLALSRSDGADQTRVGTGLGTVGRNGEPYGELGMFLQQDVGWNDQTGGPSGPQPQ